MSASAPFEGYTVRVGLDVSASNLDAHATLDDDRFLELVADFLRRFEAALVSRFPGADVSVKGSQGGRSAVSVDDETGSPVEEDPGLIEGAWSLWDQILDEDAALRRYDEELEKARESFES